MSERVPYDYAVLRVVPHVEREEFINVGLVLFSRPRSYLGVLIDADERISKRVSTLAAAFDTQLLLRHLAAIQDVCEGADTAGPIAQLSLSERFHWLTTHRSTAIQSSVLHSGSCLSPEETLRSLFKVIIGA